MLGTECCYIHAVASTFLATKGLVFKALHKVTATGAFIGLAHELFSASGSGAIHFCRALIYSSTLDSLSQYKKMFS